MDRLQLTAVYSDRRVCVCVKTTPRMTRFRDASVQQLWLQYELTIKKYSLTGT